MTELHTFSPRIKALFGYLVIRSLPVIRVPLCRALEEP